MNLDQTFRAYTAFFDEIMHLKKTVHVDRVELVKQLRLIAVDLQLSDDPRGDVIMRAAELISGR